jgi:hypothetical protein
MLIGTSVEQMNPEEVLSGFEWDVDIGLVDRFGPGGAFVYLPEEDPTGLPARMRFEEVPDQTSLVVATAGWMGSSPSLYFIGDDPLGHVALEQTDVLGLETGLDMADGRGPVTPVNQPYFGTPEGFDADSDPTLAWIVETSGIATEEERLFGIVRFRNPFAPPGRIRYVVLRSGNLSVEIMDVAGRRVRCLTHGPHDAGEHLVMWDGLDDRRVTVSSGLYFLRIGRVGEGYLNKLLVLR